MRRCEPQLTAGTAVLTSQHAGAIRRVGEDKTPRDHPGEACSRKLPQHSGTPAPRRGRVVGAHALIRRSTLGGGQTLGVGWGGYREHVCVPLCVLPCFSGQEKVGL